MYFFHQRHDQLWDGGGLGNRLQPERALPLNADGDALGLCQPQDDPQRGQKLMKKFFSDVAFCIIINFLYQALAAATINAAHSIGRGASHGSLQVSLFFIILFSSMFFSMFFFSHGSLQVVEVLVNRSTR